jgi:multiple sugar transport system ATP-binding protein
MNIGTFPVKGDVALVGQAEVPLARDIVAKLTPEDENKITIGFRPENIEVTTEATPGAIPVEIDIVEELGSDAYAYGSLAGADPATTTLQGGQLIARVDPRRVPKKGETVYVAIRGGNQHAFSAATGERL